MDPITMSNPSDLLDSYKKSLIDLKSNSKPLISCLTILAGENLIIAEGIVQLIESRFYRIPAEQKLLHFYLIDSICKNIGDEYVRLFAKNLVKNFCHVFETGDEKIRSCLFKMRQTWKALFPQSILYQIDITVKKLDPNWPVTAKIDVSADVIVSPNCSPGTSDGSPTSQQIHINPDFKRSLDDKDERKFKFKKLTETEQLMRSGDKNNSKRVLEHRSPSPDRKRSPTNWNNTISRELNTLNNNLTDLNNQMINGQNQSTFLDQRVISNFSNTAHIPGLNSSIMMNSVSNHPPTISQQQPILSNIQSSIVPQPSIVSSTQPSTLANSQTSLNNFMNRPATLPANVLNHQLPVNLTNTLNSLNHFNLPNTTKDVDYRINDFNTQSQQPSLPQTNNQINNQLFNTFNERLINVQHNQMINLTPEELKLNVNNETRKLFYLDDHTAIVLMNCLVDLSFDQLKHLSPLDLDPRLISFDGQPVNVYIDEKNAILLSFNAQWKLFYHNGFEQKIKFGGPVREIYLNNQIIQAKFGGPCVPCKLNGDLDDHTLRLDLPAPRVKLSDQPRIDLWIQLLQKYSIPSSMNNNNQPNNLNGLKSQFPMSIQQPIMLRPPIMNSAADVHPIAQQIIQPQPQQPPPPFIMTPSSNPFFTVPPTSTIPLIGMDQKHTSINNEQSSHQQISKRSPIDRHSPEQKSSKTTKNNKNKKSRSQRDEAREPVLELKPESLKIKRQSLIDSLYSGAQCTNCSLRFNNRTDKGKSKYSAHLDWHFRQNRRTRDNNFKTSNLNREWYLPLDLWVKYKEINMEEENEKMLNGLPFDATNNKSNDNRQEQATQLPVIQANSDDSLNICSVCYERFNQTWSDDDEEWRLENAVQNEDKYYHPTCLTDMMNKTIEEEKDEKSEETILRITDSILENYKPSLKGDKAFVENEELENLKIKEESSEKELENTELFEPIKEESISMEIDQTMKDEILRELNQESQSEVDESKLEKKTVLNFDDENEMTEECKSPVESPVEQDTKADTVSLNIPKIEDQSELTNDSDTNRNENKTESTVKKIELSQPNKKTILLKLNVKDSNTMSLNQRKAEQVNSPKSENSKSPVSPVEQRTTESNGIFEPREGVIYRGREESALCSIM